MKLNLFSRVKLHLAELKGTRKHRFIVHILHPLIFRVEEISASDALYALIRVLRNSLRAHGLLTSSSYRGFLRELSDPTFFRIEKVNIP